MYYGSAGVARGRGGRARLVAEPPRSRSGLCVAGVARACLAPARLVVSARRMQLHATIRGTTFRFGSVKEVLAKANPPKSGDDLAGVSARDPVERVAARAVLSQLTLREIRENPVVPYEEDELTRIVEDTLDEQAYPRRRGTSRSASSASGSSTPAPRARPSARSRPGLTPEMAAARGEADVEPRPHGRPAPSAGGRARQQHARAARPPLVAPPAEPPDATTSRASSSARARASPTAAATR